jgi:carbonic anhydrase
MNTDTSGQILSRLAAGNLKARQSGKAAVPGRERVLSVALLTCADERIVPEVLFDMPPGTFYTVRIAGNVFSPEAAGSLEVAVVRHRCPLVLILGHTGCSAVALSRSRDRIEGSLYELSRHIRPVMASLPPDATYEQAVEANVLNTMREFRERCRSLREREERGELKIAGAVYDLESGAVRMVG